MYAFKVTFYCEDVDPRLVVAESMEKAIELVKKYIGDAILSITCIPEYDDCILVQED